MAGCRSRAISTAWDNVIFAGATATEPWAPTGVGLGRSGPAIASVLTDSAAALRPNRIVRSRVELGSRLEIIVPSWPVAAWGNGRRGSPGYAGSDGLEYPFR